MVVDSRTASRLGSLPRLLLVRSVNAVVRLVDPQTGRIAELHTEGYFKAPPSVCFGVLFCSVSCARVDGVRGYRVASRQARSASARPLDGVAAQRIATVTPSTRPHAIDGAWRQPYAIAATHHKHTGRPVRVAARAFCGVGRRTSRKRQGSTTAGEEGVFQKTKKAGGAGRAARDERLLSRRHFGKGARFRGQRRPDHVQDASRCVAAVRRPRSGL